MIAHEIQPHLIAIREIVERHPRPLISNAEDAAAICADLQLEEQERLEVLLLDVRHRLIARTNVYRGTLTAAHVRLGELFREAVRQNASALIVVHNHPSGDPTPSQHDIAITHAIKRAGDLLDIEVLDHVVVGLGRHASLRTAGLF